MPSDLTFACEKFTLRYPSNKLTVQCARARERERETDRERQRETERDRETERQRQTERDRERQRDRQTDKQTENTIVSRRKTNRSGGRFYEEFPLFLFA